MSFSKKVGGSSTSDDMSPGTEEFTLRVPKNSDVKYQVMKFNSNLNINYDKWSHANLERDANKVDGKIAEEDMPKFGAGSEFGRHARQGTRKGSYVCNKKVSESSPWTLKVDGKKFRGVREGGITDNSSYYLFSHGEDGIINAHKLEEWYNFLPVQQYKTLTSEEAEEEFGRRNRVLNHFNLMVQKRLKNEKEEEVYEDDKTQGTKTGKSCKIKELQISEMEEWEESEEDESEEEEQDDEEIEKKKIQKQKRNVKAKQKKKSKGSDESATEESDDGDEEGRELDYVSDSSDDLSDVEAKITKEMQGVSEEKALKSLLTSDEDDDENTEKEEEQNNTDIEEEVETKEEENKLKKSSTNKKNKKTTDKKSKKDADSDSDSEPITQRPFSLVDGMKNSVLFGDPSYQSMEPTQKKARVEFSPVTMPDIHGITEEAIRRYLSRKPVTTTQLVTKLKNRSNLSSEQLVRVIALLLKRINPAKKMIKNKMYFFLKH